MVIVSEMSHVKNVDNFVRLRAITSSYGPTYKPADSQLQSDALEKLEVSARNAISEVVNVQFKLRNVANERDIVFKNFSLQATRCFELLRDSQLTTKPDKAIALLARNIRSTRSHASAAKAKLIAAANSMQELDSIRTMSKLRYESIIESLEDFIAFIDGVEGYNPKDEGLKVGSMKVLINKLKDRNIKCSTAAIELDAARYVRNSILYTPGKGLVDVALSVKKYVKATYGVLSLEYRRIAPIGFRNM